MKDLLNSKDVLSAANGGGIAAVAQAFFASCGKVCVFSAEELEGKGYLPDLCGAPLIVRGISSAEEFERTVAPMANAAFLGRYRYIAVKGKDGRCEGYALVAEDEPSGFNALLELMRALRLPGGCPWDIEQTHRSIKFNSVEEAYELLDAIEQEDDGAICEEAGDLLLQTVFHARIAEEQERFNIYTVLKGLCDKIINRHSHIFGSDRAESGEQALNFWDKNKKTEKHFETYSQTLAAVPKVFPALMRAQKLQKRAAKCGFDFASYEDAAQKITEEFEELLSAAKDLDDYKKSGAADVTMGKETQQNVRFRSLKAQLKGECGDLLFAASNVVRLLGFDCEECLGESSDKFVRRFTAMEELILADGHSPDKLNAQQLDGYYRLAKLQEKDQVL